MEEWNINYGDIPEPDKICIQNQLMELALFSESARFASAARSIGMDDNFIFLMQQERAYAAVMTGFKQYEDWKKNRNPQRAILEEKCGFDSKHAAHLI